MNWKTVVNIITKFLGMILPMVTPELKKLLDDFLRSWHKKALDTANPWDDFVSTFLINLLNVDTSDSDV